jgi:MFS family permease
VGTALFAAFAVYLAVFALFFLTALNLDVGLHYSGWRLAGVFAPMAAAIVLGGLAAGPWVARHGSRAPMVTGCVLGAAGMLLARFVLGRLPIPDAGATHTGTPAGDFAMLLVALAVAGLGFGITVVPLTSAVLSHVPGRHSGMAASATNTARQLGAVTGVAALGAIVNAYLVAEVNAKGGLLRASILSLLETGGSGSLSGFINAIPANYIAAFRRGLEVSLVVATVLIVLAGITAAFVRDPVEDADAMD